MAEVSHKCNCNICGKEKTYKSRQNLIKLKDKPCRSCTNSIIMGGKGNRNIVDGKYECSKCNQNLSLDKFYFKNNKPYSYCKECHLSSSKEMFTKKYKYSRYGLTKHDYDNMLKSQDNKCATCSVDLKNPHIDHCHTSGKVRGLLCSKCNKALGLVNDNTETLHNLIKYLEEGVE